MFRLLSSAVEVVLGEEEDYFDFTTAEVLIQQLKNEDAVSTGCDGPQPTARKGPEPCENDNPSADVIAASAVLQFLQSDLELGSDASDTVTEEEAMLDFDSPVLEADGPGPEPDALYYAVFNDGALDHVYGHMNDSSKATAECGKIYYPDTSLQMSTKQEIEATLQKVVINPFKSLKEILREVGPPEDGQSVVFDDVVSETVAIASTDVQKDAVAPLGKSTLPNLQLIPVSQKALKPASKDDVKGPKRPQGPLKAVSAPEPTKQPKSKKGKKKATPQQTTSVTVASATTSNVQTAPLVALSAKPQPSSASDTLSSSSTLVPSAPSSVPSSPSTLKPSIDSDIEPPQPPAPKSRWFSWIFGPTTLTKDDDAASSIVLGPTELTSSDVAELPAILEPSTLTDADGQEHGQCSLSVLGPSTLTEIPKRRRELSLPMRTSSQSGSDGQTKLNWTTKPEDLDISKKGTTTAVAAQKKVKPLPLLQSAARAVQPPKIVPKTQATTTASNQGQVKPASRLVPDSNCASELSDAQKLNMSRRQRQRYTRRLRREKEAAQMIIGKAPHQQAVVTVKAVTKEAVKIATVEPAIQGIVHNITEKAMQAIPLNMRLLLATLPFRVCISSTIEAYSYASMVYVPPNPALQQEFGPHHLVMWTDGSEPVRNFQLKWRMQSFAVVYRNNPIGPGQEASGWEEWAYTANIEGRGIHTLEATAVHMALGIAIREVDRRANTPNPITKLTIFTDSQQTLCNLLSNNAGALGTSIIRYGDLLASKGVTVELRWVPSHAAVPGNEAADRLAMLASQFGPVPKEGALIRVPVPLLRMCQKQLGLAEVFSRGENSEVLKPFLWTQKQGLRDALGRTCLEEGWGEVMAES